MTRIALLSTSDTDLLAARGSGADLVYANPTRVEHEHGQAGGEAVTRAFDAILPGVDLVV